ncbi:Cytochrome oxidase biogenesis protein Surf1, facilitates heme A insertion [uncultured Gammaproteobacteria bacterium]|jgi:surfeit locus 1 family protein|uniref:SURF1-like protein n=3 Tax=sulfur-oxidizing symbionts TaxID=32036 RepID=A0A1H6KE88_9GAMM|nr:MULTISPECIES: SURF1 family protein [sulfur-oxidizing symbionts]CAC9493782.1 Cytochrome oxidase biogenesis protein Surf1, facilitates heme A insertion [uncultured Gammaproteobacteria bacterium]CAB5503090.1 Cytochrome oxidase biogenesis protein Surf1, facilitates heme A insertion [Bathymodiolus thermophilus thioautotrophic gill symbiont]CAB5506829.1 Cytochrome oxidase biogenesis protein Surf1, facilitates heme A insertion [Bathymodiolus azoricus thioautotrophic gill symbiont]CAC9498381.1 Cytoc
MIKRTFVLPGLLIVLTIVGLLLLGFWQLERADEKHAIEHAIVLASLNSAQLVTQADTLIQKEYYQVLLEGRYDNDKQFIYDNQIVNGNAGYYVLTPFILDNKTVILVNRGFVPWYGSREKLVDIAVSEAKVSIQVRLIKPKERIKFKQNDSTTFPMLIQSLNIERLSHLLDYQLVAMLAQLDVKSNNGFYRQWQPFYGSVDKHLGYALQWFLMAFILSFIAIRLWIKNTKN